MFIYNKIQKHITYFAEKLGFKSKKCASNSKECASNSKKCVSNKNECVSNKNECAQLYTQHLLPATSLALKANAIELVLKTINEN